MVSDRCVPALPATSRACTEGLLTPGTPNCSPGVLPPPPIASTSRRGQLSAPRKPQQQNSSNA
eukprot:15482461-Alexandrium_andersonii.AAC.1